MSDAENGTPAGETLRLEVWQFVRLMVQMEESLGIGGATGGGEGAGGALRLLYDRWEDDWAELDARLVDLGRSDPDGFADLMMNQEVVLEDVSVGARRLVAAELEKVVAALKRKLAATDDPAEVTDLSFERDELALTAKALRGDRPAPAGARKGAGGKGAAAKGGGKTARGKKASGKKAWGKKAGGKPGSRRGRGGPDSRGGGSHR